MPDKLDPQTRAHVAHLLPDAIRDAMEKYIDFLNAAGADDKRTKDYHAHIKACKDALSHLETLFKLAAMTKVHTPETDACQQLVHKIGEHLDDYTSMKDAYPEDLV